MNFSLKTVEEYSLFLNKFWNIIRFAWMNIGTIESSREELYTTLENNYSSLLPYEKWILAKLQRIIEKTTSSMEDYSFSAIGLELISFIRDDFSDFAIEAYKIEKENSKFGKEVISVVVLDILSLMHPFIPHITEALYAHITHTDTPLATTLWPAYPLGYDTKDIEDSIERISSIIRIIRNIRAEKNIKPSERKDVWITGALAEE